MNVASHTSPPLPDPAHDDHPATGSGHRIENPIDDADHHATAEQDAPVAPPRPRLSTAWWGLLLRAIAAFVILMAANSSAGAIAMPIAAMFPPNSVPQGFVGIAMYAAVGTIVVLLVWLWMRMIERRDLRAAGWTFSWAHLGWLGVGTLASVVVMGVIFGVTALLPGTAEASTAAAAAMEQAAGDTPRTTTWLLVVFIVAQAFLLQGIPEELLYRGWLFSVTRARPILTLVWTSLAFAAIHVVSSGGQETVLDHVLYLATPLGFGAFAGALVLLTDSMWVAAGVHGGFHIANAIFLSIMPLETQSTDFVIIGAVYLVATAIALAIWARRRNTDSST